MNRKFLSSKTGEGSMAENTQNVVIKPIKNYMRVVDGLSDLALDIADLGAYLRRNAFLTDVKFTETKERIQSCKKKLEEIDENMGSDS
jgi:hypothetical protein